MIAQLSWPAIMAQISSVVMQYIDTAMVGHLGSNASAAIGVVAPTSWLFGDLCVALTVGFNVAVAQLLGARQSGVPAVSRNGPCRMRGVQPGADVYSAGHHEWAAPLAAGRSAYLGRMPVPTSLCMRCPAVLQLNSLCAGLLRASGNMKTPGICMASMCLWT